MNLVVNSSPHIHGGETTRKLMLRVVLALLPALAAGVYFFGPRVLTLTLTSMAACLVFEWLYRVVTRQSYTLPDGVKGMCGGLGQNVFNPALGARAFLMLFWPQYLVRFPETGSWLSVGQVDMVSSATPLHHLVMPSLPDVSLADMFLGNIGGSMGEVCTLAILLGGIYLIARKVISWRIPVAYLGTVAVLTLIFSRGQSPVLFMAYHLLGGGVMLGAFFMATDYATSPVTPVGQLVYGLGCGVLTVILRCFGLFPEGVTYAILIMNACAWAIDRITPPRRFGGAVK